MIQIGAPGLARVSSILCLGAHCDDIEIGCGGTILKILAQNPGVRVDWVVLTSNDERAAEASKSADLFLSLASDRKVELQRFRNRYLPYTGAAVKEYFDLMGTRVNPDVIFTHFREDYHQDHRVVSELTLNTFRDHLILEYEIPKYDGDFGRPNVFVGLQRAQCEQKIGFLLDTFPSQRARYWFSEETFWATLRLRGIECKAPEGYAEGFHCRKLVLA